MLEMPFHKHTFYKIVMELSKKEELSIYESILELCNEHDLDPEDVAQFIQGPLKEKLRNEIMDLNILPNTKGNSIAGL